MQMSLTAATIILKVVPTFNGVSFMEYKQLYELHDSMHDTITCAASIKFIRFLCKLYTKSLVLAMTNCLIWSVIAVSNLFFSLLFLDICSLYSFSRDLNIDMASSITFFVLNLVLWATSEWYQTPHFEIAHPRMFPVGTH
ncbi:hypothetical protein MRV_0113 [Murid herpesvirus 3]|uniref:Uncharacterized protein n=2 Tax=Murid betaherpesvirus 3 TaxID=2560603 RepID=A0A1P8VJ01_9BETA|nr:hypothetical protein MRV_0113 [Murine roseolovirus]APZ76324.1 hypothetical protein MRV_0113 [Murid betaherpesvirus 3]AYH64799.1 hypothetical protein MRV_0113 [Murid herpesvirus 3]